MLVDSHCHLDRIDLTPFNGSMEEALASAKAAGVEEYLCVAIDKENQKDVIRLAEEYNQVFASVGIHPLNTVGQSADVDYLVKTAEHPKVVAIGETGLDYFYAKETKAEQTALFHTHVQAAVESKLPLIIHTRDARADTLAILREENAEKVGGVLHCFTESLEMALEAIDLGFYISFSGIVTFNNADELREVAKQIPADRILVETDSPYLTPAPHRGKPNSPRHVLDVAKRVANVREAEFSEFCAQTTENYRRLFFPK